MPIPVPAWPDGVFPDAKSLNLALYTSDGTLDNPTGVAWHAYRPLFLEAYTHSGTFHSLTAGSQSTMSTAASSASSCLVVLDTAGYFGQTSDLPGQGYYSYTPAVEGGAGDGVTPGGWTVVSSFVPVVPTATQTAVSADLLESGAAAVAGARQAPNTVNDSTPFFCDLVNSGGHTWTPAVTLYDSASATTSLAVTSDGSGETPRFAAMWAAVSATTTGQITYSQNGIYSWTAPPGVTQVTPTPTGAGAGGGAGNVTPGGIELGGGGAGAGETAQDTVGVTPGDVYAPTVGAGGAPGVAPGGNGSPGGSTFFTGDSATVTGHGASPGLGATTAADGAGGAGGTGSGAATHFNGGAGAAGVTATYGGGGGGSASTTAAGKAATSSAGAPAIPGGGPGGAGGAAAVGVVQQVQGSALNVDSFAVTFGSALQAGNALVMTAVYASSNQTSAPTLTLNDGTVLANQVNTGQSPAVKWQMGIYTAFNVTGGQTSVTVAGTHGGTRIGVARGWEVSGLGPSPNTEATNSNTNTSGTWTVTSMPAGAPDFWVGATSGETADGTSYTINVNNGNGWTAPGQISGKGASVFIPLRSGYQVRTAPGTLNWSGTQTEAREWGCCVAAFTAAPVTPGAAPLVSPGGGGGGGFGANNGGPGDDGALTLMWTGVSGSGYGTPPLPAPYTAWSPTTRVGTAGDPLIDVDINGPAGITDVVNFLSNPPVFRISTTTAQSLTTGTLTALSFTGASATVDSYLGYSAGTYTVQRAGLYLFHGAAAFTANTTGVRQCGATVNGTTYWGPAGKATAAGTTIATKTQVFSLQVGDTVQLSAYQTSGGSLNTSTTDQTRFFLVWLSAAGTPPTPWMPPDTTYRWVSGTPVGALPGLFQTHLANDLGFLVQKPYLLAYQSVAQSGLTASAFATVTMDTVAGIAHSDTGDNYSGWVAGAANNYTAPVNGWYLIVAEYFLTSSAASGATAVAGLTPFTSGGIRPINSPDIYQQMTATTVASAGAGCTALAYQYMLANETIIPQAEGLSYSGTFGTLTGTGNGGTFASHLDVVWLSNLSAALTGGPSGVVGIPAGRNTQRDSHPVGDRDR